MNSDVVVRITVRGRRRNLRGNRKRTPQKTLSYMLEIGMDLTYGHTQRTLFSIFLFNNTFVTECDYLLHVCVHVCVFVCVCVYGGGHICIIIISCLKYHKQRGLTYKITATSLTSLFFSVRLCAFVYTDIKNSSFTHVYHA